MNSGGKVELAQGETDWKMKMGLKNDAKGVLTLGYKMGASS